MQSWVWKRTSNAVVIVTLDGYFTRRGRGYYLFTHALKWHQAISLFVVLSVIFYFGQFDVKSVI